MEFRRVLFRSFGSFCSATETKGTESTIGKEKQQNLALTEDEDGFVAELMAGLTAYPRYYAHMAPLNQAGPAEAELGLPPLVHPAAPQPRLEQRDRVADLPRAEALPADPPHRTV